MKYSITIEEDVRSCPLAIQSKFARSFTHFSSTTLLQVTDQNKLRLNYVINQYGEDTQEDKCMKNMELQVEINEQFDLQGLRWAWPAQQQWILFFENPFRIIFVLKKYAKLVPIVLEEQLQLVQMSCWVNYPDAVIYGHKPATFTNHIYSINLMTFQLKELSFSKNYYPGNRKDYWAYFSDNRLYVYGGVDKNGKPVQQLFWTFNIQNGNWFALDMPSNNKKFSIYDYPCEFQSGKVLVLRQGALFIVELYQSRVNQVEGWKQFVAERKLQSIAGLFVFNGDIYIHDSKRIIPYKVKINKIKASK